MPLPRLALLLATLLSIVVIATQGAAHWGAVRVDARYYLAVGLLCLGAMVVVWRIGSAPWGSWLREEVSASFGNKLVNGVLAAWCCFVLVLWIGEIAIAMKHSTWAAPALACIVVACLAGSRRLSARSGLSEMRAAGLWLTGGFALSSLLLMVALNG